MISISGACGAKQRRAPTLHLSHTNLNHWRSQEEDNKQGRFKWILSGCYWGVWHNPCLILTLSWFFSVWSFSPHSKQNAFTHIWPFASFFKQRLLWLFTHTPSCTVVEEELTYFLLQSSSLALVFTHPKCVPAPLLSLLHSVVRTWPGKQGLPNAPEAELNSQRMCCGDKAAKPHQRTVLDSFAPSLWLSLSADNLGEGIRWRHAKDVKGGRW